MVANINSDRVHKEGHEEKDYASGCRIDMKLCLGAASPIEHLNWHYGKGVHDPLHAHVGCFTGKGGVRKKGNKSEGANRNQRCGFADRSG